MKDLKQVKRLIRLPIIAALFCLWASGQALAQCSMCKSSIAGSSDAATLIAKVNFGILLLFVPVFAIMITIIVVIYRYRDSFNVVDVINVVEEPLEQPLPGLDSEDDSGLLSTTMS